MTCSFSCLARFKQPSDGCVGDKMPLALSELAGPELALVSLSDPSVLQPASSLNLSDSICVFIYIYFSRVKVHVTDPVLLLHTHTHTYPVQPVRFLCVLVDSTNITCN